MQTSRTHQLLSYAKVLFSVIVWGASFIATKVALKEVSPDDHGEEYFGIGK